MPGVNHLVNDIVFTGCNVRIVNGPGDTATTHGTGNLAVCCNEDPFGTYERGGSHNIVGGLGHEYGSFGGQVAGLSKDISGPFASVSGGANNEASGSTGEANEAEAQWSTVSGEAD